MYINHFNIIHNVVILPVWLFCVKIFIYGCTEETVPYFYYIYSFMLKMLFLEKWLNLKI